MGTRTNRIVMVDPDKATDLSQFRFTNSSASGSDRTVGDFAFDTVGDLWTCSDKGWKPVEQVTGLILETDSFPSMRFGSTQYFGKVVYSHNVPYTRIDAPEDSEDADAHYGADLKIPDEPGIYVVTAFLSGTNLQDSTTITISASSPYARSVVNHVRRISQAGQDTHPTSGSVTMIYANTTSSAVPITIEIDPIPYGSDAICRVALVKVSELDSNEVSTTIAP